MNNLVAEFIEHKPTLEEAQKLIGGYVELIQCKHFQLLVDEDGRPKRLPINTDASFMAGRPIVGPAIVLYGNAQWLPSD
jgi:hypothetical protein